jgi:type II secretory pathway component PulF
MTSEKKERHSRNLAYLGFVIGIVIPSFTVILSVQMPELRAMFFEAFFVIYSISIPLGFIIFLYAFILRQKLNLNKWYEWCFATAWFLGASLFFLATFNRL